MNARPMMSSFRSSLRNRFVLVALCVLVASGTIAGVAFAGGSCVINGLANGVPGFVNNDPAFFKINVAPEARWAAVAMRNTDAADWNLEMRTQSELYPLCASNTIVSSNVFGNDVIAIDGRVGAAESEYIVAHTSFASGFSARIEYEQPAAQTQSNSVFELVGTGPENFLTVREVQMFAGIPYAIRIAPGGLSALHLYVFAPSSTGPGRQGRSEAALDATIGSFGETEMDFTAATTGPHAIVIVNEDGTSGAYAFAVGHCPFFVSSMTEGVPRFFATIDDWPGFTPNAKSWPVVGVRGAGFNYDLDVAPNQRSQFGQYSVCTDSVVGSQLSGVGTRVVTGDFQKLPLRLYTAHASIEGQQTSSAGTIEWDGAGDVITVNAAPTNVVPPANNVLDAWKISLVKNVTYQFNITKAVGATADYRLLLFGNPSPGQPYWANRADAILEATGPHFFIPGITGLYGVVVVNDNGGTGNYSVQVTANLVDVPGAPVPIAASRIRAAAPNPSAGAMRIDYELANAGDVEFRLHDVAGRTVAKLAAGWRDAGIASFALEGVAPGVYFLSLVVDGVEANRTRVILLR